MTNITWLHPAPYSVLPITHPARAHDRNEPDVSRTWEQHAPIRYVPDDYERVQKDDWLEIGAFK